MGLTSPRNVAPKWGWRVQHVACMYHFNQPAILDDFVVPPTTYLFKHFTYLQHFTTIICDGHAALENLVK